MGQQEVVAVGSAGIAQQFTVPAADPAYSPQAVVLDDGIPVERRWLEHELGLRFGIRRPLGHAFRGSGTQWILERVVAHRILVASAERSSCSKPENERENSRPIRSTM